MQDREITLPTGKLWWFNRYYANIELYLEMQTEAAVFHKKDRW